jgi:alkylhydroperoxidase/carboxymuconolactone decarboxylase family protein YurZ
MRKPSSEKSKTQKPVRYQHFEKSYPAVIQAVEALGEATQSAGPLDSKTRALVKLAIAVGALREGAVQHWRFWGVARLTRINLDTGLRSRLPKSPTLRRRH